MGKKVERYSDIIDLPHHQSGRRPHMPVYNRAAQFAPFAALVGYDEMVENKIDLRLLNKRIILDEDCKKDLEMKLKAILGYPSQNCKVKVCYFVEKENKLGGAYLEYEGEFKNIKEYPLRMLFLSKKEILLDDIIDIEIVE